MMIAVFKSEKDYAANFQKVDFHLYLSVDCLYHSDSFWF